MELNDQADSGRADGGQWRMQLEDMRTIGSLRPDAPAADAAVRLSDRALRAAMHNPDHSVEGRRAAETELRARGGVGEPWRLSVPTFLSEADAALSEKLCFGWPRRLRIALGMLASSFALAALTAFGAAQMTRESADLAAWLAAAAVACALLFVLASALRAKPVRVTVIADHTDIATQRMIQRELRPFGHAFMLTPEAGAAYIGSARAYRSCAALLRRRLALNLSVLLTRGAPVQWRPSAAWRALTLSLLARSSDAVLLDVSALPWTLEAFQQDALLHRCVFVALWGQAEQGSKALQSAGIDARLFAYAPDGEIQHRDAFRAAVHAAIRAAHAQP